MRCLGTRNSDNIYKVTVVASDGVNTATRSVTVKVTDADEGGKVTLSAQDALIGVELTATLDRLGRWRPQRWRSDRGHVAVAQIGDAGCGASSDRRRYD